MLQITTIAMAAVSFALLTSAASAADRIRYECKAEGEADISMSARFEDRGDRQKFSTEFEAAPNLGFKAGDRITIKVKSAKVGSVELVQIAGGDVVGDFNLDTQPNGDAEPFPETFPKKIKRDTEVRILKGGKQILACSLRVD